MGAVMEGWWHGVVSQPIVALELRRIRRLRWWPGRRFALLYPALLGALLGCAIMTAVGRPNVQTAGLALGALPVLLLNFLASFLGLVLPWMAPALIAPAIAREREMGTLDLLRATLLGARAIVLGKLTAGLARLAPALLAMAMLIPFQLIWSVGFSTAYTSLFAITPTAASPVVQVVLALLNAVSMLTPWSDLALHMAVSLLVSVLARSSGAAIAISYGAIIALRAALWLFEITATGLLSGTIFLLTVNYSPESVLIGPAILSIVRIGAQFAVAAIAVWAAVRWFDRF